MPCRAVYLSASPLSLLCSSFSPSLPLSLAQVVDNPAHLAQAQLDARLQAEGERMAALQQVSTPYLVLKRL